MTHYTFHDWWANHKGMSWLYVGTTYRDLYPWYSPKRYKVRGLVWEVWYYLRCRFWTRYNRLDVKTLPPTWMDKEALLLHAAFEILRKFVEEETPFDHTMLDHDEGCAQPLLDERGCCPQCNAEITFGGEVRALYDWWMVERPRRIGAEAAALDAWHDRHVAVGGVHFEPTESGLRKLIFSKDEELERLSFIHYEIEAENDTTDQTMLHRLIDIRRSLWT